MQQGEVVVVQADDVPDAACTIEHMEQQLRHSVAVAEQLVMDGTLQHAHSGPAPTRFEDEMEADSSDLGSDGSSATSGSRSSRHSDGADGSGSGSGSGDGDDDETMSSTSSSEDMWQYRGQWWNNDRLVEDWLAQQWPQLFHVWRKYLRTAPLSSVAALEELQIAKGQLHATLAMFSNTPELAVFSDMVSPKMLRPVVSAVQGDWNTMATMCSAQETGCMRIRLLVREFVRADRDGVLIEDPAWRMQVVHKLQAMCQKAAKAAAKATPSPSRG